MKVTVNIYKGCWPASRPWCADLKIANGEIFRQWQHGFRTKKALLANVKAALDCASSDYEIKKVI